MYIEPNTVVRLLNNIRLDNRYTDTINFGSRTEQVNYFSSKTEIYILTYKLCYMI